VPELSARYTLLPITFHVTGQELLGGVWFFSASHHTLTKVFFCCWRVKDVTSGHCLLEGTILNICLGRHRNNRRVCHYIQFHAGIQIWSRTANNSIMAFTLVRVTLKSWMMASTLMWKVNELGAAVLLSKVCLYHMWTHCVCMAIHRCDSW